MGRMVQAGVGSRGWRVVITYKLKEKASEGEAKWSKAAKQQPANCQLSKDRGSIGLRVYIGL